LFTLLVVMVVIGPLAGQIGPQRLAQIGKPEVKVAKAQIDVPQKALDPYRIGAGHHPSSDQGFPSRLARPGDKPRWAGRACQPGGGNVERVCA
jgi:general secretion pathway protein G